MTSRYFVIGGRGYIGAALYAAIPDRECTFATASVESEGFIRLRLEVPQDFSNLPISFGDVAFLTAAISSPDVCVREHDRAWAANVSGTSEFIDNVIARGGRVVFFSSDTVYGERTDPFDETAILNPAGAYAEMKAEVETRFLGHPLFRSIRLSYVFSRLDKFTRYLSSCTERGEEAELFHPFYRAIVYRDDVVEGALALARHWDDFPQPVINFCGPEVLSRIDFAERLMAGALPSLRFQVTEPGEEFFHNRPRVIAMSSSIFPSLLGRSATMLADAVRIEFGKN
jgi:nucleoside-diphosphate-sugar epimerase